MDTILFLHNFVLLLKINLKRKWHHNFIHKMWFFSDYWAKNAMSYGGGVGHYVLLQLEGVGHMFSNHHILKCVCHRRKLAAFHKTVTMLKILKAIKTSTMERKVYSQNSHIQCWVQTDCKYVLASLLSSLDQSCIEFVQLHVYTEVRQSQLAFVNYLTMFSIKLCLRKFSFAKICPGWLHSIKVFVIPLH